MRRSWLARLRLPAGFAGTVGAGGSLWLRTQTTERDARANRVVRSATVKLHSGGGADWCRVAKPPKLDGVFLENVETLTSAEWK